MTWQTNADDNKLALTIYQLQSSFALWRVEDGVKGNVRVTVKGDFPSRMCLGTMVSSTVYKL